MKRIPVVWFLVIGLVLLSIASFLNYRSFSQVESVFLEQLQEKQEGSVIHAADDIEDYIFDLRTELVRLSTRPSLDQVSAALCQEEPQSSATATNMLRVNPSGTVAACSSNTYSDYFGLNIGNKDYFLLPQSTKEPYITTVENGGTPRIVVAVPLFATQTTTPYPNFQEDFSGVLVSFVDVHELFTLFIEPALRDTGSYFVLRDDKGTTVLRSSGLAGEPFNEINQVIGTQSSAIKPFGSLGETILTKSSFLVGTSTWDVVVITPLSKVNEDIQSVRFWNLLSFAVLLILASLAGIAGSRLYFGGQVVQEKLEKAQSLLDRYGVKAAPEEPTFSETDVVLQSRTVYLIREDHENHAHELFLAMLSKGYTGFAALREHPEQFRKRYRLEKTSCLWITTTPQTDVPCAQSATEVFRITRAFIAETKRAVVLIDRLDFLIRKDGFSQILAEVAKLRDFVQVREALVLLSIQPETITQEQHAALDAETTDPITGAHSFSLSEIERSMLEYINERNTANRLVSFKDITTEFKITKPTTRTKLGGLLTKGLIRVEQRGRRKAIFVTSSGRRILR